MTEGKYQMSGNKDMRIHKKRNFLYILLLVPLAFCSCGRKMGIGEVVTENQDLLKAEAESVIAQYRDAPETFLTDTAMEETLKDSEAVLKDTGQWGQNACIHPPADCNDDIVLIYECSSTGLMTSTYQWGFYYTQKDMAHLLHTAYVYGDLTMEKEGIYSCMEEGGDNFYKTIKICEHFYYYETGN